MLCERHSVITFREFGQNKKCRQIEKMLNLNIEKYGEFRIYRAVFNFIISFVGNSDADNRSEGYIAF